MNHNVTIVFTHPNTFWGKVRCIFGVAKFSHCMMIIDGKVIFNLTWDGTEYGLITDNTVIENASECITFGIDDHEYETINTRIRVAYEVKMRFSHWYFVHALFNKGNLPAHSCSSVLAWLLCYTGTSPWCATPDHLYDQLRGDYE